MATTVKVMSRQAAGQARLLFRALRSAELLLMHALALGITVTMPRKRRRKREGKEEPRKPGRKGGLKQVKEEE